MCSCLFLGPEEGERVQKCLAWHCLGNCGRVMHELRAPESQIAIAVIFLYKGKNARNSTEKRDFRTEFAE